MKSFGNFHILIILFTLCDSYAEIEETEGKSQQTTVINDKDNFADSGRRMNVADTLNNENSIVDNQKVEYEYKDEYEDDDEEDDDVVVINLEEKAVEKKEEEEIEELSPTGIAASAYFSEVARVHETTLVGQSRSFLSQFTESEIEDDIYLLAFSRFVEKIPLSPDKADFHTVTYPLDHYTSLKRLIQDWTHHLLRLRYDVTPQRQSTLHLQNMHSSFLEPMSTDGKRRLYYSRANEKDLEIMEEGIRRIMQIYKLQPTNLTESLSPEEVPKIISEEKTKDPRDNYDASICRGDSDETSPPSLNPRYQYCYYQTRDLPYYRARVEQLHIKPWAALYHDICPEWIRQDIMMNALDKMSMSGVAHNTSSRSDPTVRLSLTGWLKRNLTSVDTLYRNIAFWQNLRTTIFDNSAESLQVVNYGIGGMFRPHYDYHDETKPRTKYSDHLFHKGAGHRLMTWMFYFTSPTIGGATVFPELGLRVAPRRGSGLVWENLKPDGSFEPKSKHGGCAVAVGQKWIGNVWIRSNGQMFTRPCPLEPSPVAP